MPGPDKTKLKKKMRDTLAEVERRIAQLEDATRPIGPENAIGRVSRMDAINQRGVAEAGLRSAQRKRDNLLKALQQIDRPGFGLCQRCKSPIPEARLMFMPESTRCVACAGRA